MGKRSPVTPLTSVTQGFAATAAASPTVRDDLKRIEGIGPKMNQALRVAGIETFARSPSIATWAKQAKFLADDDEAGFVAYINHLVGGVEPDANGRP